MSRKLKVIYFILAILLVTVSLAGCTKSPEIPKSKDETNTSVSSFPLTITDQIGRKVTIETQPERIVSLAPSNTEILFALGLEDKVVGVTDYCDYPEAATKKEKVGGDADPNIEKIISLKHDIILSTGLYLEPVEELEKLGVPSIAIEPQNFDEMLDSIELIGKVTGRYEEARALVDELKARIKKVDDIVAEIPPDMRPKVLYELWHTPIFVAGPGSYADERIRGAGGENISKDAGKEYPEYSQEMIIAKNPDIIMFSYHGTTEGESVETIMQRPGWESINAVKNNKVFYVDENLVQRATPRLVDGLELIVKIIHPELFND